MGKGDKRRPTFVEEETFEARWQRTFGRRPQDDPEVVDLDSEGDMRLTPDPQPNERE